ncbi:MAG: MBL fold metallo-hydrolase [Rhizobiales bacterium]|nr:MBL fold metallo-hydrolase [Hyphomicrobiales bacterium]
MSYIRQFLPALLALLLPISSLQAAPFLHKIQTKRAPVSTCMAIAQNLNNPLYQQHVSFAKFETSPQFGPRKIADFTFDSNETRALTPFEVRIGYFDHSTYVIESADGITAATDYFGWASYKGEGLIPTIVTMNKAHMSHFTASPDPRIEYILPGWGQTNPAKHFLQVQDMLVRNVTTDIIRGAFREDDANSIFIFEVAGLCIGHLGHLHHPLVDAHYAQIGRLDVVMVPIDGALTLSLGGMAEILKRLRARVILPMHARGFATPDTLISMLGDGFESHYLGARSFILSMSTLPRMPTVLVPLGL